MALRYKSTQSQRNVFVDIITLTEKETHRRCPTAHVGKTHIPYARTHTHTTLGKLETLRERHYSTLRASDWQSKLRRVRGNLGLIPQSKRTQLHTLTPSSPKSEGPLRVTQSCYHRDQIPRHVSLHAPATTDASRLLLSSPHFLTSPRRQSKSQKCCLEPAYPFARQEEKG